jgi:hypothetical protein
MQALLVSGRASRPQCSIDKNTFLRNQTDACKHIYITGSADFIIIIINVFSVSSPCGSSKKTQINRDCPCAADPTKNKNKIQGHSRLDARVGIPSLRTPPSFHASRSTAISTYILQQLNRKTVLKRLGWPTTHVVVVDPGTLVKCQCTPLPTRRYNHGEVASTIIELHCNSIAASLGAGVDCYLTWILIFRRDQVIRVVSQNHWWEWATFSQEGSRGKVSPFASMLDDRSTPCRRRLSNHYHHHQHHLRFKSVLSVDSKIQFSSVCTLLHDSMTLAYKSKMKGMYFVQWKYLCINAICPSWNHKSLHMTN